MFCQECGKPVDAGIRYCPHCGANVSEQAPEAGATEQTQPRATQPVPPIGQYAEFGPRLAAFVIDLAIPVAATLAILVFAVLGGGLDDWPAIAGFIVLSIVVILVCFGLYEALLTSSRRQATLGKRALGIVVTGENGGRISFARAAGRHIAKWISWHLLFIGYLMQPFTPKKQALHDLLAGTLVVKP